MKIDNVSAAFTTNKVSESRDFYVRHLNARVTFDCGWYVNLEFGDPNITLQFMSPQQPHHKLSYSDGLIYNFKVDGVDRLHERFREEGLQVIVPLEDHPWGDRGFAIQDPNGISIYFYEDREPSGEFKRYYKD
jgi:uncharacterized glyoxalase superfamily protein PhnB